MSPVNSPPVSSSPSFIWQTISDARGHPCYRTPSLCSTTTASSSSSFSHSQRRPVLHNPGRRPNMSVPSPSAASLGKERESRREHGLYKSDPRTSSSQSLRSVVSDSDQRRTLLIIYIHGFYGNDQSFRSFPYHVHSYLKIALQDSHVIHSKIYPRYKTYRAIEIARDNFSQWLMPHEGPNVDVILVGHSMGGMLASEVVLMQNRTPYLSYPFKHRILGTVSLDSPFLGLHPGIIVAGISSLFQPSPSQPSPSPPNETQPYSSNSASQSGGLPEINLPPNRQPTDPLFDPPFWNDNPFKEAPFIKRIVNFANKHKAEGIVTATAKHVLSHLEYGGCLADLPGLRRRYDKIRALEDIDELSEKTTVGASARVRFVNYYTISSGRPKMRTLSMSQNSSQMNLTSQSDLTSMKSRSLLDVDSVLSREQTRDSSFGVSSVNISVEDFSKCRKPPHSVSSESEDYRLHDRMSQDQQDMEYLQANMEHLSMQTIDPTPMPDSQDPDSQVGLNLPPIPELPIKPVTPDLDQYTDKDARKLIEKEAKRLQKGYEQAVKDRNRALRNREKFLEKRRKKAQKDSGKEDKETLNEIARDQKSHEWSLETEESTKSHNASIIAEVQASEAEKPKKRKKFCNTPRKQNGVRDSAWVDVYMDGMDEVSAHCGLFFSGPHYDRLIGDVGDRIIGWVQDDMTKRTVLEMNRET